MDAIFDIIGALILVAGTAFLLLGGLGLYRMPDVFNRIQAGTKETALTKGLAHCPSFCPLLCQRGSPSPGMAATQAQLPMD